MAGGNNIRNLSVCRRWMDSAKRDKETDCSMVAGDGKRDGMAIGAGWGGDRRLCSGRMGIRMVVGDGGQLRSGMEPVGGWVRLRM